MNKIFAITILLFCLFHLNNLKLTELEFLESKNLKTGEEEIKAYIVKSTENEQGFEIRFGDHKLNNQQDTPVQVSIGVRSTLEVNGWDFVYVSIENTESDDDLNSAYYAGYLEGSITYKRIENHYLNMNQYIFSDSNNVMPDVVKEYLTLNQQFIDTSIKSFAENSSYWKQVQLIYQQLKGLRDGFRSKSKMTISDQEFEVMNSFGDLFEVGYWKKQNRPDFTKMDKQQINDYIDRHSHCSSLIKIADNFSDILFGHTTWFSYLTMTRMYKEYDFKFGKSGNFKVSFSGYPGTLSSVDDFYLTGNNLYVAETTNDLFNNTLYDSLDPQSQVLCSVRTIVANRLATTASEWVDIFLKYNSGTYNNQFMVLDLNKIDLSSKTLQPQTFMIVEQLPGDKSIKRDVTDVLLSNTYWASYNSPYISEIRTLAGYDDMLKQKPELADTLDYVKGIRSQIFKRDHNTVQSIDGYKKLLRYNDYKNDPLSKNDPGLTISSRFDLDENKPNCYGGLDTKAVSFNQFKKTKQINIVSGPSFDNQPKFKFSTSQCNVKSKNIYNGMPDLYAFDWIEYQTSLNNY